MEDNGPILELVLESALNSLDPPPISEALSTSIVHSAASSRHNLPGNSSLVDVQNKGNNDVNRGRIRWKCLVFELLGTLSIAASR